MTTFCGHNLWLLFCYFFVVENVVFFWDLPYWKTNIIRHNLDVMHIEKKVFDNIFNTILNFKGRSKDNAKSRADLQLYYKRNELDRDLSLVNIQKLVILWIKDKKKCYVIG